MEKKPTRKINALLRHGAGAAAIGGVIVASSETPPSQSEHTPLTEVSDLRAEASSRLQAADTAYEVSIQKPYRAYMATPTRRHNKLRFTGYEVKGLSSTFGPPLEGAGRTADGGSDYRACIAIRNDSTLDHKFLLKILYHHHWYRDITFQCDYGPGILERAVDNTGEEVEHILHINPRYYPTDEVLTIARELKGPKVR